MTKKTAQRAIGFDEVVADLKGIIEEFGEGTVYGEDMDKEFHDRASTCRYRDHTGEPQCIVGQWMARRGVNLGALDERMNEDSFERIYHGLRDAGEIPRLTWDAVRLLDSVQDYQDNSVPWGDSLRAAIEDLPTENE